MKQKEKKEKTKSTWDFKLFKYEKEVEGKIDFEIENFKEQLEGWYVCIEDGMKPHFKKDDEFILVGMKYYHKLNDDEKKKFKKIKEEYDKKSWVGIGPLGFNL